MNKVNLGKSGLKTSPIIFGCNVFGWTLIEKESFEMLDRLIDMDINTLDTADVYSRWVKENEGGESEIINASAYGKCPHCQCHRGLTLKCLPRSPFTWAGTRRP